MKWRKWNRAIHRDLGYFFTALTVIYSLSGIALNHLDDWNPSYSVKTKKFKTDLINISQNIDEERLEKVLKNAGITESYKKHYRPDEGTLRIFVKGGNVTVNLKNGDALFESLRKRPLLYQANFLHYNNPKKIWTWISDFFALSLIILAISGLFILRGKNGIKGRGAWLTFAGLALPLIFMFVYGVF